MRKLRSKRLRRTQKQVTRHGDAAKRTHTRRGGRSGSSRRKGT